MRFRRVDEIKGYTPLVALVEETLDYFRSETVHAGQRAPDFSLPDLEGRETSLSQFRGQPVLIEFGSISCPNCIEEFKRMDDLSQEFRNQAHFLFIYVREIHPGMNPKWSAHKTIEQKNAYASALAGRFITPRTVLVDDLDGSVHRLYGGLPNMSWIIDHAGLVAHKASWTTYPDLKRCLDEVLLLREQKKGGMLARLFTETMTLRPRQNKKARKEVSKRERER